MGSLFLVNACINRNTSRTLRLARAVAEHYPEHEVEELILEDMRMQPLDSETVNKRTELCRKGDFNDPVFDIAKKFASADIIIIATPFWENTFNSYTKIFMEYAGAVGVAFRYSETGMPIGMCKAKKLYYVTTRGGPIPDSADLGFAIYKSLCQIYGIPYCLIISAAGLDIITNDAEAIMKEAIASIPGKL